MSDSKRTTAVLAAAALAAAVAAFFAKDALIQPATPVPGRARAAAKRTVPAGPQLVLERSGARRDLAAQAGKGLILHFWATWCAPCREEMPELVKFVADM